MVIAEENFAVVTNDYFINLLNKTYFNCNEEQYS